MHRLLILFAIIGALAVPTTAAAVEPTRTTVHVTVVAPLRCPSGATLIGVFDVTREITTFYDNEGNAVRELWVASFEGTMTNPVAGQSVPVSGVRVIHRDLVTGEAFSTGTNVMAKLPDGDVWVGGVGRLVLSASGVVEHDGPDTPSELTQLCAALGA